MSTLRMGSLATNTLLLAIPSFLVVVPAQALPKATPNIPNSSAFYSPSSGLLTNNPTDKNSNHSFISDTVNQQPCQLQVDEISTNFFTALILKKRYNLVHFRLQFNNLTVDETKTVIGRDHWLWTYKGQDGGHRYLFLPNDYGYLSFGILLTKAYPREYYLNFNSSGNCTDLRVGTKQTDMLIGEAMGNMTSVIASKDDRYNSSYWCYSRRLWLYSDFLYKACKNSVCTFQTFEYRCCRYNISFQSRNRSITCPDTDYRLGKLWWMFPIIVGEICFAFYPLLLTKIASAMQNLFRSIRKGKGSHPNSNFDHIQDGEGSQDEALRRPCPSGQYVWLKYGSPVSFMSTICSPLLYININGPITNRILRSTIIFLPMSLTALRLFLEYTFAYNIVKEAVRKGALIGFSSMLAGYRNSRTEFLHLFGGPYVAISIYIIFGCACLSIPNNLESALQIGLFLPKGRSFFVVTTSIDKRERFSRVYFQKAQGYKRIHRYMKAKFCMLLNIKFWKHVLQLFDSRWRRTIYRFLKRRLHAECVVYSIMFLTFPIYLGFCVAELLLSTLYLAFPVISAFFLLYKAFSQTYFGNFKQLYKICQVFRIIAFIPLSASFCITWYMYCIIFFDGFWFLSKIAMFTYSGIIAYPKLSYGYLILSLMAVYYLVDSVRKFGENYKDLLKITIEAYQRLLYRQNVRGDDTRSIHRKGVPLEVFSYVVERHLPVRNQVANTLFKFISIVTILGISIELLIRFDKFEDLSLVSHVFTVLFICALPKIIRVVILDWQEHLSRKKLTRKVQKTVERLMRSNSSTDSDDDDEEFSQSNGYQRLQEP